LPRRARSALPRPVTQRCSRTKPQIAAYGLIDSPAGLAAWIVEKFSAWSDGSGDVERAFSRDDLLTKVYWGDRKNRLFDAAHRESSANPSLR
jgi:hypothetical protein